VNTCCETSSLDSSDRDALVLRYFEQRDLRAVGVALGISDDAAQKRVSRAVEKLRELLVSRKASLLPVGALSLLLGSRSTQAAPAGLGSKLGQRALAAAGATGGIGLMTAVLNWLSPVGTKAALGAAAALALAATLLVQSHRANQSPQTKVEQSSPQSIVLGLETNVASEWFRHHNLPQKRLSR
jgi:hypothetical protein